MFIIKYKNFFLALTALLMIAAAGAVGYYGLNEGIDFKGGSALEVDYPAGNRPTVQEVNAKLAPLGLGAITVQPTGSTGMLIRTRSVTEPERAALVSALGAGSASSTVIQKNFTSVGPLIGSELRKKSAFAIGLVIMLIMLYITFAFRHVSRPVASWKYGVIAIITLAHDVIIPMGVFAVLGHYYGVEIDVLFVTAILAILGFSIHDTIVVFDRIRENLRTVKGKERFAETVGKSLGETFTRSINTSLTVILTLIALYVIGGESTKNFALVLLIGITAGTYSSVFFASPLLVVAERLQSR